MASNNLEDEHRLYAEKCRKTFMSAKNIFRGLFNTVSITLQIEYELSGLTERKNVGRKKQENVEEINVP